MVVLYSDVYLEKLWTVYELATYLLLYPDGALALQPVFFARAYVMSFLLVCLSRLLCFLYILPCTEALLSSHMHMGLVDVRAVIMVVLVPLLIGLTLVFGRWAQEVADIKQHVRHFSIHRAACKYESDRAIVEANVASFAKVFGYVEASASAAESLAAFDKLVQKELPFLLRRSFGIVGIPYQYASAIFSIYIPYVLDAISGAIASGDYTFTGEVGKVLWAVGVVFGIGPLTVSISYAMARCFQGARGVGWAAAVALTVLAGSLFYSSSIVYVMNEILCRGMAGHKGAMALMGPLVVIMVSVAYRIYRRPRPSRKASARPDYHHGSGSDSSLDSESTSSSASGC